MEKSEINVSVLHNFTNDQRDCIILGKDLVLNVNKNVYEELRNYARTHNMAHPLCYKYKYVGYCTIPATKINKATLYRMVYKPSERSQ